MKDSEERVAYQGRLIEIVELPQPNGKIFEVARRAPGVRLIVPSEDGKKLLMTREFRREAGGYDYRLPGGKVFDSLKAYEEYRKSGKSLIVAGEQKAREEGREETGLNISDLHHFVTANCGATVDWDLYYFEVTAWTESGDGQKLEQGEDITVLWLNLSDIKQILAKGDMQEYRSAGVLVQWLSQRGEL